MLGQKMEEYDVNVWLINTGWTGGVYGVGSRMKLSYTRAMITAALNGTLENVGYRVHSIFGVSIPMTCPDVPSEVLSPRETWKNDQGYYTKANELADAFLENFKKYEDFANEEILAGSAQEVLGSLKNGQYSPVYFLHGDEEYFIDLITDHIEQHALDETAKGFNQLILYGKDTEVRDILTQARRFPMMSERQTVIVKEAQEIKDLNKEDAQTLLEEYLKNPLPSTILVLSHKHKTFDKRKKLAKSLDKLAVVVESKKLYDNKIPDWIRGFVKDKGHAIDDKAAFILAEYIGTNLQRLSNEIDKILINFKEPITISPDLIQKYVGINKDYNSFELQRAIAMKN
ncbi:Phosphoenolpyruvate carboxykinase (ATP) (PCK) (PEP carboxykinase) (PEPCK), partial [Durusdinium trenchii]